MTSLILPDLNVWLALSFEKHAHSAAAWAWYRRLRKQEKLAFCRMSQLGFLRLATTPAVAQEETLTPQEAWRVYDGWTGKGGAIYLDEPLGVELELRFHANRPTSAYKDWGDSYLIAFAASASLPLVTFDKALSGRYARAILITP